MEELIATNEGGSKIPLHPEDQYPATCIDIINRGKIKTVWDGKEKVQHKVTLRFFCGEWFDGEDGKLPLWVDKWFTLSMHEKANLRAFINAWRGKPVTEVEAERFNLMTLLHKDAMIQVVHSEDGKYANIGAIMKLKGENGPGVPEGYVRVKDRPPREEDEDHGAATKRRGALDPDDDDLPF